MYKSKKKENFSFSSETKLFVLKHLGVVVKLRIIDSAKRQQGKEFLRLRLSNIFLV